MKRDYDLIKEGRYNKLAIMQLAWALRKNPFCSQYRNSFKSALEAAWVEAELKMDEYKSSLVKAQPIKKEGNVLKDLFLSAHPEYSCYDSSWR